MKITDLQVENIRSYKQEHIEFPEGTVLIHGENGAGKTTTLRSIAGAEPPIVRSGTIRFDGTSITEEPAEDVSARGISLVPEERRVFANLSVEENLQVPDISKHWLNRWGRSVETGALGLSDAEIYDQFPRLDERRGQKAGTLSGGEQQMLAIARTLKQDTKLLMLDEPSEGLAPQIVQDVLDIIEDIAQTGKTILLVEQNAVAAMELADYCYVLDQGQIVFDGPATELQASEEIKQDYLGV